MILLKELKLNNFLSHESTSINFAEGEKTLIDGKSGSGKSSLTEAILWALYGKGRSDNRSLVRRGAKTASVALKLVDGSTETLITRTTTPAGKNTLNVTQNTGTDGQFLPIARVGSKDIQSWIEEEYLKASYELFTNSVAYPQENENSFVKATASKRKDLLLEIVRAGNFDDLYEMAKQGITQNDLGRAADEAELSRLERVVAATGDPTFGLDEHKKTYADTELKIRELTVGEKELEGQVTEISGFSQKLKDKKTIKQMLEKSIEEAENQLAYDQTIIATHNQTDVKALKKDIETLREVQKEQSFLEEEVKTSIGAIEKMNAHLANRPHVLDYSNDIATINQRLIPLLKETDKCPAGDKCPFVLPIQGQIDFLVEQITEREDRSIKEKLSLEKWEHDLLDLQPVSDVVELYKNIGELKDKAAILSKSVDTLSYYEEFGTTLTLIDERDDGLQKKIESNKIEMSTVTSEIKNIETLSSHLDVNKINAELSRVRVEIQNLRTVHQKAAIDIEVATRAQLELKEAKSGIASLQKGLSRAREDKENLELLKEALSPRGIKAVIIDYLVPRLEENINGVLSQMSDFRIRLDTQMPTADEEGKKEGLFITVINDCLYQLPFEAYSGGERVKITIAISEALASLMGQVGFRVMDENIVSLDKDSTEGFIAVLAALQDKFPQLLVVSHLQEVKDVFEKKITVTKINGVSKII